jgi:hypothetical protein
MYITSFGTLTKSNGLHGAGHFPRGHRSLNNFPTFYVTRRFVTVFTKSTPLVPILSHINLVHTTPTYLCKIHLNDILPPTSRSS